MIRVAGSAPHDRIFLRSQRVRPCVSVCVCVFLLFWFVFYPTGSETLKESGARLPRYQSVVINSSAAENYPFGTVSLSLSTSANAPPDGDHQLLERTVKRNKRHPKTKEEMRKKNEATGDDGDTGVTR